MTLPRRGAIVSVGLAGSAITIAAFAFACSSSSSPSSSGPSADAGADVVVSEYTLADVCARVPAKVCALRKGCCTQSLGFDEAACEAFETSKCQSDLAAVDAGAMTFDGTHVDECLARIAPYFDICYLAFDDFVRYAKDDFGCATFAGKLAVGAACDRNEECAPATSPTHTISCDQATSVCKDTVFLGQGAPCSFGPGISQYCSTGLFCDFSADAAAGGSCQPATPRGQPCSSLDPYGLECGLGSRCDDGDSGTCQASLPSGSTCVTAFDCASLGCTAQVCDPATPAVHASECGTSGGKGAEIPAPDSGG